MGDYDYKPAGGFEWIRFMDARDLEILGDLNGASREAGWLPIRVRSVAANDDAVALPADFPFFGSDFLVLRATAVLALRDLLAGHGELLPLESEDARPMFLFHARTVDALDEARSSIMRFPGTQKIMRITQVAFHDAMIADLDVFRLTQPHSKTYVSQRFVERVQERGLTGLLFRRVWPL